jgi:hypothetical protein
MPVGQARQLPLTRAGGRGSRAWSASSTSTSSSPRQTSPTARPRGPAAAEAEADSPYALRHTFASNALAAGVVTFELSRYIGTSVEMLERTYGHLVEGHDDAFRARMDAFATARSGVDVASASEGGM